MFFEFNMDCFIKIFVTIINCFEGYNPMKSSFMPCSYVAFEKPETQKRENLKNKIIHKLFVILSKVAQLQEFLKVNFCYLSDVYLKFVASVITNVSCCYFSVSFT